MRNHRLYLKDIFEAIDAAQGFVEGMNFDAFVTDDKTASAVVRKLEIIGEAAKNVPETIRRETHKSLGSKRQGCETGSSTDTLQLTTS